MNTDRINRFREVAPQLQNHHETIGYVHMGVVLVIALATLYVIYKIALHFGRDKAPQNPLLTAKSRYAAGDITKEELAEITKTLKS